MTYMDGTWYEIISWTSRMAKKYGGTVYDTDGITWDWGQAICRVLYGPNWNDSPEFEKAYNLEPDLPAPDEVMNLLETWEGGEWPDCIRKMEVRE